MKNINEMNKAELRAACKEHGVKNYGKMNNDGMREAIQAAIAAAQPVAAPAPVKAPVKAPKGKGIKIQKDREERNGVKRPSAGGKCAEVWDWCDAQGEPKVAQVVAHAIENDWNVNNAKIEFYKWRKFNK